MRKQKFDLAQLPSSHAEVFTHTEQSALADTTPRRLPSKAGLIEDKKNMEWKHVPSSQTASTLTVQSGHHMFLASE